MAVHRFVSVKNFLITPLDGSFLRAARFQTIIHRGADWRELAIISRGQGDRTIAIVSFPLEYVRTYVNAKLIQKEGKELFLF